MNMTRKSIASVAAITLTWLVSGVSSAQAHTSTSLANAPGAAPAATPATASPNSVTGAAAATRSQALLNQPLVQQAATPLTTPSVEGSAGSVPIGSARYGVPSRAIWVATWGNDASNGGQQAPLRTIAAAIRKASNGSTIVVRAGSYHESLALPAGRAITIENMPGEKVWLDGTSTVSGFSQSGNTWVKQGWNTTFDASHTFQRGASDGPAPYWQFVNPAHPMAAHPDQVWVGGHALTQVASASAVTANTFYVDYSGHRLVIGTNPAAGVRASTLNKAVTFLGDGSTLRGVGVWGYADSVPDMGAVVLYARNVTLENLQVLNSATTGVGVYRSGATLRHVTIDHSGLMGLHGNLADNLTVDAARITASNTEQFNTTPAAAAMKLSATRTVTLRDSVLQGTIGNAFWTDESCYDIAVVHNRVIGNAGRGIFLELSQKAVVVGNVVADNTDDQIRIANTDQAQVWNNTIIGSTVPLHIAQDSRTPANSSYAVDTRRPSPDPDMTWVIKSTTMGNNVLQASGTAASALLLVEDWTKQRTGSQLVSSADGDLFSQPVAGRPGWVVAWAHGAANDTYTTLSGFQQGQGKEGHGRSHAGSSAVDSSDALVNGVQASSGVTLPGDVATRAGVAQVATVGAW